MKKILLRILEIAVPLIGVAIFVLSMLPVRYEIPDELLKTERTYKCDYHTLAFKTHISFEMNGTSYDITGNFVRFYTDPLTMTSNGKKVGYADDAYNFIGQDDHAIYVNDEFEVYVLGGVQFIGEGYELYDRYNAKVGYAKFNGGCTSGAIYDKDGNVVATYSKPYIFNDYTVKIYDNDICSDKAMLMIFASYVSDYHADRDSHNDDD